MILEKAKQIMAMALHGDRVLGSLAPEMVLACEKLDRDQWQATIMSDQLTLDHKIKIEKAFATQDLSIKPYFRRSQPRKTPPANPWQPTVQKKRKIPGVGQVIVVGSCKGGVGKSTIAANLACSLSISGLRAGLLDADLYGPSDTQLLNIEEKMQTDEEGFLIPQVAHGIEVLSFGSILDIHETLSWRGPLASKTLLDFCFKTRFSELDVLVIDLPPGTGDIPLSLLENVEIAGAILVTTPQLLAIRDLYKEIGLLNKFSVPILGVVENQSYFQCPHCHEATDLRLQSLPLKTLMRLPFDPMIQRSSDLGQPVVFHNNEYRESFRKLSENLFPNRSENH